MREHVASRTGRSKESQQHRDANAEVQPTTTAAVAVGLWVNANLGEKLGRVGHAMRPVIASRKKSAGFSFGGIEKPRLRK